MGTLAWWAGLAQRSSENHSPTAEQEALGSCYSTHAHQMAPVPAFATSQAFLLYC